MAWPYYLTPLIPAAVALNLAGAPDTVVFFVSALGLIPPAALMGDATEELAARSGPGVGGILNVTFGNAPELIVALFALGEGLHEVVKASLVGSVIGNILLVLGAAMLFGGRRNGEQRFETSAVRGQTRLLLLAGAAPVVLAIYALASGAKLPGIDAERVSYSHGVELVSALIAVALIAVYAVSLRLTLREYAHVTEGDTEYEGWSTRRSVALLAVAGALVGLMSEILVGSISATSHALGLSEFFIGAVVVAIVGNAAEHWVAVLVAVRNQMDLTVAIGIGSSAQVAAFLMPVLVLCSFVIGPGPMPLVLNPFALGAIVGAVLLASWFTRDGRTTAREGALLLGLYAGIALAFGLA